MLGVDVDTDPEDKAIQGVTGEQVYFDESDGMLKANLKVMTVSQKNRIDQGKTDLSLGYTCVYVPKQGIFQGQPYEFIQTKIRANHLATVEEGRMGKMVSVQDSAAKTQVFDHAFRGLQIMPNPAKPNSPAQDPVKVEDENTVGSLTMKELTESITSIVSTAVDSAFKAKAEDMAEETPAEDMGPEKEDDAEDMSGKGMDSKGDDISKALDSIKGMVAGLSKKVDGIEQSSSSLVSKTITELNEKDTLVKSLGGHINAFDAAPMNLSEVIAHGVKELGIKCSEGNEKIALDSFLQALNKVEESPTPAGDSVTKFYNFKGNRQSSQDSAAFADSLIKGDK